MNTNLFLNQERCNGKTYPVGHGTAAVYTARSPDHTDIPNEDSAAVLHVDAESGIIAVADGAGGLRGGAQASSLAMTAVQTSVEEALATGRKLRVGILNAFEKANHEVMELSIGAATTMAVVEIQSNHIRPYHAGDSTILVVGQRGKIKMQIIAHSPVGYAVESGMLDEDDAMYHKDRHIVSNLLGSADMHIQVGPTLALSRRDTVLVASDGLSDNLHTAEIVELIRKGPLETVVSKLAEMASSRMREPVDEKPSKPDDLTFAVFRLKD